MFWRRPNKQTFANTKIREEKLFSLWRCPACRQPLKKDRRAILNLNVFLYFSGRVVPVTSCVSSWLLLLTMFTDTFRDDCRYKGRPCGWTNGKKVSISFMKNTNHFMWRQKQKQKNQTLFKKKIQVFFADRRQKKNTFTSSHFAFHRKDIPCGVPQGSILSSLLFNVYMLPLSLIVHKHNINMQMTRSVYQNSFNRCKAHRVHALTL